MVPVTRRTKKDRHGKAFFGIAVSIDRTIPYNTSPVAERIVDDTFFYGQNGKGRAVFAIQDRTAVKSLRRQAGGPFFHISIGVPALSPVFLCPKTGGLTCAAASLAI